MYGWYWESFSVQVLVRVFIVSYSVSHSLDLVHIFTSYNFQSQIKKWLPGPDWWKIMACQDQTRRRVMTYPQQGLLNVVCLQLKEGSCIS